METSSATEALRDLRTHATQILGHVTDYHQKFQAFEHDAEQRFAALQHAQEALLQHLQQERDRAREEANHVTGVVHDATEWLHTGSTEIQAGSKALDDDFDATATECAADTTALQQAVDHLAQLVSKSQQDYGATGDQLHQHVDAEHTAAHEQFVAGVAAMQQAVTAAATQHEGEIESAFHSDFTGHQQQVHSHVEQLSQTAQQTLHGRGETLQTNVQHEVENLHQGQDQHHADLTHQLDNLKNEVTHMGSLVTDTAHGLGDGVDSASLLLQQTNLGLTEVQKIITNVEAIFQDIIGKYHS